MANGIIIVDKPAGWTSQDVAAKLRGVFHERRVGHGGTLDPMATGVLPVFVGRATRGVEFFTHAEKEYEAELLLGQTTTTQDTTGTVLTTCPVDIREQQLRETLTHFLGPQQQLPPMYSAIKIGGKKLYELARAGQEVERTPRNIEIFALECLSGQENRWNLRVRCSKGTYIRTLCADIGQNLGCGGCMAGLRRTRAGEFCLKDAHTMEEILAAEDPASLLLPVDRLFSAYPSCTVSPRGETLLRHGAVVKAPAMTPGQYRVYSPGGEFLALCQWADGQLKTVKSFFTPVN